MKAITFQNVSITVKAKNDKAAYTALCNALAQFEFLTDTFYEEGKYSHVRSTDVLFPKVAKRWLKIRKV